jgi:hypothetical protein
VVAFSSALRARPSLKALVLIGNKASAKKVNSSDLIEHLNWLQVLSMCISRKRRVCRKKSSTRLEKGLMVYRFKNPRLARQQEVPFSLSEQQGGVTVTRLCRKAIISLLEYAG